MNPLSAVKIKRIDLLIAHSKGKECTSNLVNFIQSFGYRKLKEFQQDN